MTHSEKTEIDRILSEIVDEGASRAEIEKLDALLRDRPDLQEYYSQAIALHMLLAYEMDFSLQQLQPVIPSPSWRSNRNEVVHGDSCVELSDRMDSDLSTFDRITLRRRVPVWLSVVAVIGLVLIGARYLWWPGAKDAKSRGRADVVADGAQIQMEVGGTEVGGTSNRTDGLIVRDARSLAMLSRLTRTASLTRLQLPTCIPSDSLDTTLCSGTAWMERSPGNRERGYLVDLPPGYLMDVYVDTDADGQNSLAIVEFDGQGRVTGGTASFSNLVEGDSSTTQRRTGSVGNYSVLNDGPSTKYYLFTGSHILPQQSVDESWYQSDYKVQHLSEDFLVIGWDDSGHTAVSDPRPGDYTPDHDYNDISALLRFSRPDASKVATSTDVEYSPQPYPDSPLADESASGFRLDVKPGEQVVILVSGSATLQNSVRIVEDPSRRIVWQYYGTLPGETFPLASEVGVYIIRNHSATVRQYQLCARYQQLDRDRWRATPYKLLADGDGSVTVGFEDSVNRPDLVDWNDIRVHARWFSD